MKINNSTQIISAKLINSDDGKESTLFQRVGSRQHFMDEFHFQDYLIQLRLDWTDVRSGDPMLDADIWTEINGEKNFLRKGPWHHIEKKLDEKTGKRLYSFKFKNLTLNLIAKMTIAKTYSVGTIFVRFAPEAQKLLDELDEKVRNSVRQRAIKLSRDKKRDYDVRLEDGLEAKDELEQKKRER